MRIKKEGFTLIEILAIIIVLTVISSIVIPNVFGMIRNARQKSYETLINDIEGSVRVYTSQYRNDVENSLLSLNYYVLTLNDLKKEGLLKTPVIDPRTDEVINLNKKLIVTLAEDDTFSVCFEDRKCYIPTLLYNKLTENVVSGENQGLHYDLTNNYYYKGANPNNWILFNNYLWRVVKINEDGTIKIIFEGKKKNNGTEENGKTTIMEYDDSSNDYSTNINIKTYLQNWYNTNITSGNNAKVETRNWCIGKTTYSASGVSKATFQSDECNQTTSLSVGLISAKDYLYASADASCTSSTTDACKNKNYLYKGNYDYWSITGDAAGLNTWTLKNGTNVTQISQEKGVRPVVNLISSVLTEKGDGSIDNPYVIKKELNNDIEKPIISINEPNPAVVNFGDVYIDAGATAVDIVDGDLTSNIITISNVNTSIIGTYTVTYVVMDNCHNIQRATRKVMVTDPYYSISEGVNIPQLAPGMTPIKREGSTWVDTTKDDPDWYDYTTSDKKWANARTNDCTVPGNIETCSMWVWIPRFVYMIRSGWHTTSPVIDIQFSMSLDDTRAGTVPLDRSNGATASNNKWTTHSAFTFGETEIPGFWMAKFEASSSNPDPENQGGSGDITLKVKSVPSVSAWRNISLDPSYIVSRLMEKDNYYGWGTSGKRIDTHLIKNSEWGAVAYLSQSEYGKNAPVWNNPNLESTTGCAGDSADDYWTAPGVACAYLYDTPNGKEASTTGNIYGVYDMVGGAVERSAAYVNNTSANTTEYDMFSRQYSIPILSKADNRYKDVYDLGTPDDSSSNYALAINRRGEAVYETTAVTATSYSAGSMMPYDDLSFFSRGGSLSNDDNNIFLFSPISKGEGGFISSDLGWWSTAGFRPTLIVSKFSSIDDTDTRPLITLLRHTPFNTIQGATYVDAGVRAYDEEDGIITSSIVVTGTVNTSIPGTYYINYNVTDSDGNSAEQITRTVIVNETVFSFNYTGSVKTFQAPVKGKYKLEVWGAQGGNAIYNGSVYTYGGKGGYAVGVADLNEGQSLNIYVGGQGTSSDTNINNILSGGYNGGGSGYNGNSGTSRGAGGGGATDIRKSGTALSNRIIVAGGGGGGVYFPTYGTNYPGAGGGTTGVNGYTSSYNATFSYHGKGGTQSSGGAGGNNFCASGAGSLGQGGNGCAATAGTGGGGGGYYGGGADGGGMGSAGGSSYIGGVTSYGAVTAQTIAGNASMPAPVSGTQTGQSGDGYVKITYLGP